MAGQTYNGSWTGFSVNPSAQPDYWVGIDNGTSYFSLLDAGQDSIFNADVTSSHLCVVGSSDSYDYVAVWKNGAVDLTATPSWSNRGPGPNYDAAKAAVCANDKVIIASAIDPIGDGTSDITLKWFDVDGAFVNSVSFAGSAMEVANDAAIQGQVLVLVGLSTSADFPVTLGAFQSTKALGRDAIVMSVNASTGEKIFATYYGGNGEDYAIAVALDENGYIYVCGKTSSTDLTLPNAYSTTYGGSLDAFLAIWSPSGNLVMASLFGSDGSDQAMGIALLPIYDNGHLVYLAGSTDGTNFPLVEEFSGTQGANDAFVLAFRTDPNFSSGSLVFSSRFGGSGVDFANAITVKSDGTIGIAGDTSSSNFPGTGTYQGGSDAFYTFLNCPGIIPVPPSPSPSASPSPGVTSACQTADGCYLADDIVVQFAPATDGGYRPGLTVFPTESTGGAANTDTSLGVDYNRLEERDPQGNVVAQQEFPTSGYQFTVTTQDIGGTPVTVVEFKVSLDTGSNVTVYNYLFEEDTTFTFADTSFPVSASSTKTNILVENWPFQSTQNTFHMHLNLDINPAPAPATASIDGDIVQYNFDTGVSICEVSVLSLAVMDQVSTDVSSTVTQSTIQVNFPYFQNSLLYDPGYTVLVKNDDEETPKKKEPVSQWYYIGAAIGVAVIAAIIAGFMLTFMKNKRRRQRAKSRAAIQHATEQMNSSVSIATEVSNV